MSSQPQDRRAADPWRAEMQAKIERLEAKLDENTALTRELKDILQTLRGGWKFMGWIGRAVKWCVGLATGAYGLWTLFTHHGPR